MGHHALLLHVEVDFARGELDEAGRHLHQARSHFARHDPAWLAARVELWQALIDWARWGDLSLALTVLEPAVRRLGEAMPAAAPFLDAKVLALRAYVQPDPGLESAFDQIGEELRLSGREDIGGFVALDRAHLQVAAARRAREQGEDVGEAVRGLVARLSEARSGSERLPEACSRVLLAGVVAELEVGSAVDAMELGRAG